jgi:chromosome segregation ATPase
MVSLFSGLMTLALVFGAASPALAAEGTPPAPDPARQAQRLERALEREQRWLDGQTENLARANEAGDKLQTRIDELQGQGKDTSALEAALSAYEDKLAQAQAAHDAAQATLDTHAGFDDDGHLTDAAQARETLKSAGQSLREAHKLLREAAHGLRQAIREYRRENRPHGNGQPTPTAQP